MSRGIAAELPTLGGTNTRSTTGPARVSARILGRTGQRLPAVPPLDNPPQQCSCTHTRARLFNSTNAASCRHRSWTRTGTNIRASWHSAYRCCIGPVNKQSWTSICTHARTSWHSAHWRCLLLTTGPGCVPAHILGLARSLPPVHNWPWTCTCTNTWATWRSICRR